MLSGLEGICKALGAPLRGADEKLCPDMKGTAGEVKHSPREKSKTLFPHWRADGNAASCQSVLMELHKAEGSGKVASRHACAIVRRLWPGATSGRGTEQSPEDGTNACRPASAN